MRVACPKWRVIGGMHMHEPQPLLQPHHDRTETRVQLDTALLSTVSCASMMRRTDCTDAPVAGVTKLGWPCWGVGRPTAGEGGGLLCGRA